LEDIDGNISIINMNCIIGYYDQLV